MNKLPELKSRKEMLNILEQQAYGKMPQKYGETKCRSIEKPSLTAAGKGSVEQLEITVDTGNGLFSYPVRLIKNTKAEVTPVIVFINFRRDMYDSYCPLEEILDNGFSLVQIYYEDVTSDDCTYDNGLAHFFPKTAPDSPGKIALWAWSISRVIDVLEKDNRFDSNNIAVIGHSRLGKTALLCAAFDERVKFVQSNDSGCMGASLEYSRHDYAENRERISKVFPWWFCNRFNENIKNGICDESFDQHFLVGSVAPRFVCITSAEDDKWADPDNEFNCCRMSSEMWECKGEKGFICKDKMPVLSKSYTGGSVAYIRRKGPHYLSREDWQFFMEFIKSKI